MTDLMQTIIILLSVGLFCSIVSACFIGSIIPNIPNDEKPPRKNKKIKNVVYLKVVTDPTPGERYYATMFGKMEEVLYLGDVMTITGAVKHKVYIIGRDLIYSTHQNIYTIV